MQSRGKSINLYLIDGNPTGRIICTLANWTGIAFKIPRTELENSKDRAELAQTGVYFLFGTSEETNEDVVYVGQAGVRRNGDGLLSRLIEHKRNADKDYWTEAVIFTTSNNSFGPTEISYLENRFYLLAKDAGRYVVKNGNNPTPGNITEQKESELEEFIDNAKLMMGTLGHKLFEPLTERPVIATKTVLSHSEEDLTLYLSRTIRKSGVTVHATCRQTNEGFVVLKGSLIEKEDTESLQPNVIERRLKAKIDESGILLEDVLFPSPSFAAAFVIGGKANGLTEWKTKDGVSLKQMEMESVQ